MKWIAKYWIEAGFGVLITAFGTGYSLLYKRLQITRTQQDAVKNGIKALLRDRIIQTYNKYYVDKKHCPIYVLENVYDMYAEYKALGGNGTIEKLVDELRNLPTEKTQGGH